MDDNLNIWVRHITEQDMPIFKYTASSITRITETETSSASELARAILKDSSLTARVLRLANSPLFNRSNLNITTVSRAVTYIGFKRVREMSLSLAIIDSLVKGKCHDHVHDIMAMSFHAAVQARNIAERVGESSPEEFFIAALLYNLGEMAFWSLSGEAGDHILSEMNAVGLPPEKSQFHVIGTTFKDITQQLIRSWDVSELLIKSLDEHITPTRQTKIVKLAHRIAASAHRNWTNQDISLAICDTAKLLDISIKQAEAYIHINAEKAIEVTDDYGAYKAAARIPTAKKSNQESISHTQHTINFPKPDPVIQLTTLRKLSLVVEHQPSINTAIQTILEGLNNGVGLDRVVFAIYKGNKCSLQAKFSQGVDRENLLNNFSVTNDWYIQHIIEGDHALWSSEYSTKACSHNMSDFFRKTLSVNEFLVAPVRINNQPIGIFYADRKPSGRKIDEICFESFKHFCLQGWLALTHITKNKNWQQRH